MSRRKIVAMIGVRMESTRLPEKAIADVHGKPFLQRLVERLQHCKAIDKLVICTADTAANQRLLDYARQWGIDGFAGEEEDVMKRFLDCADKYDATEMIRITGDNIFTDPYFLETALEAYTHYNGQYTRVINLPLGITADVMQRAMVEEIYHGLADKSQTEYMLIYAFNPERYRCVMVNAPQSVNRPYYSLTCDTPTDLAYIRHLYTLKAATPSRQSLQELVAYLDSYAGRIEVSADTPVRMPHGQNFTVKDFFEWLDERKRQSIVVEYPS